MLTLFSRWKTKGTMEKNLKDTNQKYFVGKIEEEISLSDRCE